jgi:hypothetical protein
MLLAVLPLVIAGLCWVLRDAPPLPGEGSDALTMRLVVQAGAGSTGAVSTHALVATLALLELLHYMVWIVALPAVTGQGVPWKRARIAFTSCSSNRRRGVGAAFGVLTVAVVVLWLGFAADYARARDVYFTVAIAHVLVEVPMVLRLL